MPIEYRAGNQRVDKLASAEIPKSGEIGYVTYIDTKNRLFKLRRYIPVDTMAEVQLYLEKLDSDASALEVAYVAR